MNTTTTPAARRRAYRGPAILSYGFRPFFLLGAIYAGLAILVWLPVFHGELSLHSAFAPRDRLPVDSDSELDRPITDSGQAAADTGSGLDSWPRRGDGLRRDRLACGVPD
jgi:hypothetical protein